MDIHTLRKRCAREEIDYQTLLSHLTDYKYPRNKIRKWLSTGELIRVKKGLYVFDRSVALQPYSIEILANLIYGPSCLSLSSALSFYGIIPERSVVHTSVTPKRNKSFDTVVGKFTYTYLLVDKYAVGVTQDQLDVKRKFLIATPEKALVDQLYLVDRKLELANFNEIEHYLFDDLRCNEDLLNKFDLKQLEKLEKVYKHSSITLLLSYFNKRKGNE